MFPLALAKAVVYKELVPDKPELSLVNNLSFKFANPRADNLLLPVKDERSVFCGKSSASVVGAKLAEKFETPTVNPPPLIDPFDPCPDPIVKVSLEAFIPLEEFPGITAKTSAIFCFNEEISWSFACNSSINPKNGVGLKGTRLISQERL